jgi:hypothetical protein
MVERKDGMNAREAELLLEQSRSEMLGKSSKQKSASA